jgi:hypothetical protein
MASMKVDKVKENRLRRVLLRRGLILKKSRRRDPEALDYRGYWVLDADTGQAIAGGKSGMSFGDIESWVQRHERLKGKRAGDPFKELMKLLRMMPQDLYLMPDGSPSFKTKLFIDALSEELAKVKLKETVANSNKSRSNNGRE